jgi:hypothetical protein
MTNPFRSSSKAQMGSSVYTTQNQGGGSKKAGFPYQIGRDSWSSIFIRSTDPISGRCCTLTKLQINLFPNTSLSRNIGSTYVPNTYFKIPGTR